MRDPEPNLAVKAGVKNPGGIPKQKPKIPVINFQSFVRRKI